MDEKKGLLYASLLILALALLNLLGILNKVWILTATLFSAYLLIHDWLSKKIIAKFNEISGNMVLFLALIIFLSIFGILHINTSLELILNDSDSFTGRLTDTLALIVLSITLVLYIRKK